MGGAVKPKITGGALKLKNRWRCTGSWAGKALFAPVYARGYKQ